MVWSKIKQHVTRYKYFNQIVVGGALVVFVGASLWGYMWYTRHYNEQAQIALSRAVDLYERALQENTQALWNDADQAFSQGYDGYSAAALGPYFLVFRSEIAIKQGRNDQARELLEKALNGMSPKQPLYDAYIVKLALMKIDSDNADVVKNGYEMLESLISNAKNQNRDMALYYRGLLEFDAGRRAEAEKSWNVLLADYGADSVWAQRAQAKLDYVA